MNINVRSLRRGQVAYYNIATRSGKMKIEGEPMEVTFGLNRQRPFLAGFNTPVFGGVDDFEVPTVGRSVLAVVAVTYRRETTQFRRTLYRCVEALEWGFQSSHDKAVAIIAARPRYEFVEFTLYNGVPTSGENQRRVIAIGTAVKIQAMHPRGKSCPETNSLGYTYRRRFYRLDGDKKVQCEDPRQVSTYDTPLPFQPTNDQGVLLATKQDLIRFAIPDSPKRQPWVLA